MAASLEDMMDNTYAKALGALAVNAAGLGVTFGLVDSAQAQAIGGALTGIINVIAVFWLPK